MVMQLKRKNMMKKIIVLGLSLGLLCVCGCYANAVSENNPNKKKLRIFILAGQSNMVGHSRGHTIATLFNPDGPKDKELIQLVFKKDSKVSKTMYDEQLARARKGDELISKIKTMQDGDAKSASEA